MTTTTATTTATATTKRAGKTPEQRKLDAETLHAQLLDQVELLTDSDRWREFLDFSGSFYRYSLNNVLLILAQHPTAAEVAGFRAWPGKGRQVRKGQRAIKILGYSTKTTTEEDPDTGEETTRVSARYPILSVFALDQTDPIDDTADTSTVTLRLTGDDPAGIYTRMHDHLTGLGWTIGREQIPGGINGYTTTDGTRRIVIDADLTSAQAAKTLLHDPLTALLTRDPAGAGRGMRTRRAVAGRRGHVLPGSVLWSCRWQTGDQTKGHRHGRAGAADRGSGGDAVGDPGGWSGRGDRGVSGNGVAGRVR